jgi:hypothetical protein
MINNILSSMSTNNDIDINVSDNESDNEQNIKVSEEFKKNVIAFVRIDDELKELQNKIKELRKERKPCEEYVLKYLDSQGEKVVEVGTSKLRKNKSETKKKVDTSIIKEAIMEKVTDPIIVADIMKLMESKRVTVTSVNLKRTNERARTSSNTEKIKSSMARITNSK